MGGELLDTQLVRQNKLREAAVKALLKAIFQALHAGIKRLFIKPLKTDRSSMLRRCGLITGYHPWGCLARLGRLPEAETPWGLSRPSQPRSTIVIL
jgi:hypothetical protein